MRAHDQVLDAAGLRSRRHRLGLTLQQLASRCGLAADGLRQLEQGQGHRQLTLGHLAALAQALQTHPAELLNTTGLDVDATGASQSAGLVLDADLAELLLTACQHDAASRLSAPTGDSEAARQLRLAGVLDQDAGALALSAAAKFSLQPARLRANPNDTPREPTNAATATAEDVHQWLDRFDTETRRNYGADLRAWLAFLAARATHLTAATSRTVEDYHRDLIDQGLKDSTIRRRHSAISSFYTHLENTGVISRSPVRDARRPRLQTRRQKHGPTFPQRDRLRAAAHQNPRDHALLSLLLDTRLRINELLALDIENLELEAAEPSVVARRHDARIETLPITKRTAQAVAAYLDGRTQGPVFVRERGGDRVGRRTATHLINQIANRAGVQPPARSLITDWLRR